MEVCDLHTHSVYSDGTCTPAELLDQAEALGLSAIALTDHNTVAGLPEFLAAAEGRPVEAVAGIEFSTDYRGTELHMLGLFLKPSYFPQITALLAQYIREKEQSNQDLADALNRAGYHFDYDALRDSTPNGQINRAHIAAELTRRGYTGSVKEAFDRLLAVGQGFYTPPRRMSPFAAIEFIRSMGAAAVLAHPFLNLSEPALREFLTQAVPLGLDGMEALYATYTPETTRAALAVAGDFGLKISGGSDFHGGNKPDIRLGVGRGNLAVPMDVCRALRP